MDKDRMLTAAEVATLTRVTVGTVRTWLQQGLLVGWRTGRRSGWRVRSSEVERFIRERERGGDGRR